MIVIQQRTTFWGKVRFLLRSLNESFKQLNGPEWIIQAMEWSWMNHSSTIWMVLNESFSLRPVHRNHNIEVMHMKKKSTQSYTRGMFWFVWSRCFSYGRKRTTRSEFRDCMYIVHTLHFGVKSKYIVHSTTVHKKNSAVGTVEVQQLTVVVVPLLTLELRCRQLSPIRLWQR
jgi:hypothetical protein